MEQRGRYFLINQMSHKNTTKESVKGLYKDSFRQTFVEIDTLALRQNCQFLLKVNKTLGDGFFCPMIKANAYGHNLVLVAQTLEDEGVSHFGVSLIEEAMILREAGIKGEILVFGGFSGQGAKQLLKEGCTPVIDNWDNWNSLEQALLEHSTNTKTPCSIHLKWDTGISRTGFSLKDVEKVKEKIIAAPYVRVVAVGTHFMMGEDIQAQDSYSLQQLCLFKEILQNLGPSFLKKIKVHCFNSASALGAWQMVKQNLFPKELLPIAQGLRPGLSLYGVLPENMEGETLPLIPVMSLEAEVISLRQISKGGRVSYNGIWQAKRDSVLALVSCGYGDGYPWRLSNKGRALYKGESVEQVGRVCMNYTLFDVTHLALRGMEPKVGDRLTLLGKSGDKRISVNDWASMAEVSPYEILINAGAALPYRVKNG